jgi:aspartyl-tRNA(Asn)/glutamyl-tRNA(Gln) amidotransferase subunit B
MSWEIVVGLETHAQLRTRSKIFSGASTAFGAAPNAQACAVDIALPGVLPVLNGAAVALAIRFGLAVGATINRTSIFARKNYFYPDLPKGYQISQYEIPIVQGGAVRVALPEGEKRVALTRAHLEEDAGKSLHEDFHGMSGIDLNRAGTPLLEIVSEPELRGAKEAVAYARALHALVIWIGVCDGNMQEGSFRCDANVSVRRAGETAYGTRCEIKNLNSFRFMERAIEFEARRQIGILEDGGRIEQETRLYDPERDETRSMRSKEEAHDYRYFPDPDLLPLVLREDDIERIRAEMPELPAQRMQRFADSFALPAATAAILTGSRQMADYFEAAIANAGAETVRQTANWIAGNTSAKLNAQGIGIEDCPVGPAQLRALIERLVDGTLSAKLAKEVDDAMWAGEGSVD